MNSCSHCGTTVLFGGVKNDGLRYCSETCHAQAELALRSEEIPEAIVERAVAEVLEGNCPVCNGPGPVEVFVSYRVLSAVVVTSWKSLPRLSCRGCATKSQLANTLYCFLLGWWGFPWGLVMTPVQIFRNLKGLSREADPAQPSKLLESIVRSEIASQVQLGVPSEGRLAA